MSNILRDYNLTTGGVSGTVNNSGVLGGITGTTGTVNNSGVSGVRNYDMSVSSVSSLQQFELRIDYMGDIIRCRCVLCGKIIEYQRIEFKYYSYSSMYEYLMRNLMQTHKCYEGESYGKLYNFRKELDKILDIDGIV